jgi:hypothetical protein
MPPNLRSLMLSSVECIKQLQDLTALQTLELWSAEIMAPEVLRQISGLTKITQLRLGYFPKTPERIEEHAGVWPVLSALKSLDIQWHVFDEVLPKRVISQLRECSGLTRLAIEADSDSMVEGTAAEFVAAVQQLKQLHELRLAGAGFTFSESVVYDVDDGDELMMDDMKVVLHGLKSLQQLRSLALVDVDVSLDGEYSEFSELRQLTQLTRLELQSDDDNASMRAALGHIEYMAGLRELRLRMPVWVGMEYISFFVQLKLLQRIEYVVQDFATTRWLWLESWGRPDVCVMHIEADGSTMHVCGGECALQRHFPAPFPHNDQFEVTWVQHGL